MTNLIQHVQLGRLVLPNRVFMAPPTRNRARLVKGVKKLGVSLGNWLTSEHHSKGSARLRFIDTLSSTSS